MVLDNLADRDRNVFRILFESEPYDFDAEVEQRQAATYEKIVGRSTRQLKRELREGVCSPWKQRLVRARATPTSALQAADRHRRHAAATTSPRSSPSSTSS